MGLSSVGNSSKDIVAVGLVERIRQRLYSTGIGATLKYVAAVLVDSVRNFFLETALDLRYSGRVLYGNQKTRFKRLGANDVYHTDYSAMPLIFANVAIKSHDVLVDVGCGKGRVINYWLSQGYQNKIIGLELDPAVAAQTAWQFARWEKVKIVAGDALANLPSEGTVFYFYNPFEWDKVVEFEERLAAMAGDKAITVIYYNPKSLSVFANRSWDVQLIDFEQDLGVERWGRINKYHQLAILKRRVAERGISPMHYGDKE